MSTKKIPVCNLRVGMFIAELDRSWLSTPFLFHSKKIKKIEHIDAIIRQGIREVIIDTEKGADTEDEPGVTMEESGDSAVKTAFTLSDESKPSDPDPLKLSEELPQAKKIRTEAKRIIKDVFKDVRMGKDIKLSEVKEKVSDIVNSVFRNRDALWCLTNLKDYDSYTFTHSINVCVLAVSFGRHIGIHRNKLEDIGLGGLLHDIGKTQIPDNLLNKPGKFTEEEFNTMKRHAALGADILRQYNGIPQDAVLVTLQHHERYDGTGYSQRLCGEKISIAGQIASIADVYDAMTTERIYRKAVSPHMILRKLYEWGDSHFNRTLVERFIQHIGIYPFGLFVRLNNGQYGIVVSRNHQSLLRPGVLVVLNKDGRPQAPAFIDLSTDKDERGSYMHSIKEVLDPSVCGIDINKYISSHIHPDNPSGNN